MNFDSAQVASGVLGCEGEELHTAVFKHHLRQLLQRATGGSRERNPAADTEEGETQTLAQGNSRNNQGGWRWRESLSEARESEVDQTDGAVRL